jgi:hypothetical protein
MSARLLLAASFATALLGAADYQRTPEGLRQVWLQGRASTPDGAAGASLKLYCREGQGGWVGLDMTVFQPGEANPNAFIDSSKTFHYRDFEGPDAAAANRALTRVTVRGQAPDLSLETRQSGSFSSSALGGFVFSFGAPNRQAGSAPQRIFKAIRDGGRSLSIRITDPRDPEAVILGEFDTGEASGPVQRMMNGQWRP